MLLALQVLILLAQLLIYATVRASAGRGRIEQPARPTAQRIEELYGLGVIGDGEAALLLSSIGYPPNVAQAMLASWALRDDTLKVGRDD